MTGEVLYLKLLRLVPLFKSESEAKLPENVRFSQFALSLILSEIKITRIFIVTVDEMMTSIFKKGLSFKTN